MFSISSNAPTPTSVSTNSLPFLQVSQPHLTTGLHSSSEDNIPLLVVQYSMSLVHIPSAQSSPSLMVHHEPMPSH